MPSVWNILEAMHEASGHVAWKESMCSAMGPLRVWLADETAENIAALDYSAWITAVLVVIYM